MLSDIEPFGRTLLIAAVIVTLALLSNRISVRSRIPAPAIFLVAAAAASDLIPALQTIGIGTVEQIVTVALALILFDGGMRIGVRKLRGAIGAVLSVGVFGTFLTVGAIAALAHLLFGFPWLIALLIGTALAPTDPAVVFSVLGNREVTGRAGVIIEGESGANDPVGIALLVSLLAIHADTGVTDAILTVAGEFVLQIAIGALVGLVGGWLLLQVMRRLALPNEGLYPLRTLAFAIGLYGLATFAHGSGFLAVFIAGILIGDAAAPFKGEIERFHTSLASLAEIIAFVFLGLTVSLHELITTDAWLIGLVLALLLTFVIRPLLVGALLLTTRLDTGERIFVLWSGLKGAVPILLGTYILTSGADQGQHVYEIIFAVVLFSVVVQGALVPTVAERSGVAMRRVQPMPWAVGIRLSEQPDGARRYRIERGSPADGSSVRDLHLGDDIWISLVARDGQPLQVRPSTQLRAGDEVLVLVDPDADRDPGPTFTGAG